MKRLYAAALFLAFFCSSALGFQDRPQGIFQVYGVTDKDTIHIECDQGKFPATIDCKFSQIMVLRVGSPKDFSKERERGLKEYRRNRKSGKTLGKKVCEWTSDMIRSLETGVLIGNRPKDGKKCLKPC